MDKLIRDALNKEIKRQNDNIELIASENYVSKDILELQGSVFTNKYAEGYPSKRYYGGCENVDVVEELAISYACELFNCKYANVQPHSGSSANMAVYRALLNKGDKVMGMNLSDGGHLTHGHSLNFSGIDYEIADSVGAYLFVDMAHIAGLVAAHLHMNPLDYADVVTSTTHKTLRGPRGGIILTNNEDIIKKINKTIFPGIQGGPLMHIIAAKAECFYEALQPSFVTYQKQVLKNIKALSDYLISKDMKVISGGTDNHLILLDVYNSIGITGKEAEAILDSVHITVNKNTIPNETLSPMKASGIRIGSPAMTTRGLKEDDFALIGDIIYNVLNNYSDDSVLEKEKCRVLSLTSKYKMYD